MVNSLENIDKSKVDVSRIEGIEEEIQSQISGSITGAASTIVTSDLTANKILVSDANGKVAASAKAISDIPNDSDLVHKSDAETINGVKTFTSSVEAKISLKRGEVPSSNQYPKPFAVRDGNNAYIGLIQQSFKKDGSTHLGLLTYNGNDASDSTPAQFEIVNDNGTKYATCPTPTDDTTSSTQVDTVGARNTKLANYVTTNTAQDITATKTIHKSAPTLDIRNSDLTKGTKPTVENPYSNIRFMDNNGNIMGDILFFYNNKTGYEKETGVGIRAGLANSSSDAYEGDNVASIVVAKHANGTAVTTCPTPTDTTGTSGKQIATTGWVNTTGNNVVHLNGAETISATKTFTANQLIQKSKPVLQLKDTSITRGTAPSAANNSITINGLDSAGKNTWGIYHTWGTDKKAQTQLICYKGTTTDNAWAGIGVGYDASGNAFTSAPTPATSDNSTKIATTAYVKSNLTALLPVGTIISFAGSSTPTGFLKCDGSAVSRTTYSSLYSAIGTTYGTGDGSSTFNLPNWTTVITAVSIPSTIAVYGNGKTMSFSDGTNTYGIRGTGGSHMIAGQSGTTNDIGSSASGKDWLNNITMGLTTDSSKSGIVAKSNSITRTSASYRFCIKY